MLPGVAFRLLLLLVMAASPGWAGALSVVVSIKPLHSLLASLTDGIAKPILLIDGMVSPHDYALRPSDAQAVQSADLVVWIGPGLEQSLAKPLGAIIDPAQSGPKARQRVLTAAEHVTLLELRDGFGSEHAAHGARPGDQHLHDMHLWLDPANARVLVTALATRLASIDAGNAARYRANAQRLNASLAALSQQLATRLAPVKGKPFIVFHDGYQYFEKAYGLTSTGALTIEPDMPRSAYRLRQVAQAIEKNGVKCIFGEAQFKAPVVASLAQAHNLRIGQLDPLGQHLPAGPSHYAAMLHAMADAFLGCLQ